MSREDNDEDEQTTRSSGTEITQLPLEQRLIVEREIHFNNSPTTMQRVIAFLGIGFLLSCWVLGTISPFLILLIQYMGFIKLGSALICIGVYPYIFPLKKSQFVRWWVGEGISAFAYFKGGVSSYFMTGAREAFSNHTEEEYFENKKKSKNDKLVELKPADRKPCLIGFHPHGIFPFCMYSCGVINPAVYRVNSGITFLIADSQCKTPFWQYPHQLLGCFDSANKDSMLRHMKKGHDLAIIPGGFEEASLTDYGLYRIYLKNRKGFIKYALQYGYDLVPVYGFGEEKNYYNPQFADNLKLFLNKYQIPGVLPIGMLGYMPFNDHKQSTFYGAPLYLPKIAVPTNEDVDYWHHQYVQRVQELFDYGKVLIGEPDAKMEIL